jgi:hypothetical protein
VGQERIKIENTRQTLRYMELKVPNSFNMSLERET